MSFGQRRAAEGFGLGGFLVIVAITALVSGLAVTLLATVR